MSYEEQFRYWLTNYPHHTYKAGTINGYINALKNAAEWFDVQLEVPLLKKGLWKRLEIPALCLRRNGFGVRRPSFSCENYL